METQEPNAMSLAAAGIEQAELATETDRKIVEICCQHMASLEAGGSEAARTRAQQLDLSELLDHNLQRFDKIQTQARLWKGIAENHLPELPKSEKVILMRAEAAAAASLAASAGAIEAVVRLAARVEELRG